jgi:hypothetical protein
VYNSVQLTVACLRLGLRQWLAAAEATSAPKGSYMNGMKRVKISPVPLATTAARLSALNCDVDMTLVMTESTMGAVTLYGLTARSGVVILPRQATACAVWSYTKHAMRSSSARILTMRTSVARRGKLPAIRRSVVASGRPIRLRNTSAVWGP